MPTHCKPDPEDMRKSADGVYYTIDEFKEYYGEDQYLEYWEWAEKYDNEYILYLYVDGNNPNLKAKYNEAIKTWNNEIKTNNFSNAGFDVFTPIGCMKILTFDYNNVPGVFCRERELSEHEPIYEMKPAAGIGDTYKPDEHEIVLDEESETIWYKTATRGLGYETYNMNDNEIKRVQNERNGARIRPGLGRHLKIDFKIKTAMYRINNNNYTPVSFTTHPRSSIYKSPLRLANSTGIIDSGYRGNLGAVFDVMAFQHYDGFKIKQNDRFIQICAPALEKFIIKLVDNEVDLGIQTDRDTRGFGSSGR
jgi:dUTPase